MERTPAEEQRDRALAVAWRQLNAAGLQFSIHNDGKHIVIEHEGMTIDLWPTTDKWRDRGSGGSARSGGVRKIWGYLQSRVAEKQKAHRSGPSPAAEKGATSGDTPQTDSA